MELLRTNLQKCQAQKLHQKRKVKRRKVEVPNNKQSLLPYLYRTFFQMGTFLKAKSWTIQSDRMTLQLKTDSIVKKQERWTDYNWTCIMRFGKRLRLTARLGSTFRNGSSPA